MKLEIPKKLQKHLRVGTCSWKYDSWKGLIYDPAKTYHADDYLADYAKVLNTVEVDQWFWSLFPGGVKLPDKATARLYAESVPDDFLFTIKAPNSLTLTHFYTKQSKAYAEYAGKPNPHFFDLDVLDQVLEALSPLGKKLGPIMFQFEYLNKQKLPSLGAFLDKLHEFFSRAPKGFKYAVEIRNPNYLSTKFFDALKDNHLGFVYLEGYYMPPIATIFEKHHPLTTEFSIIRLHGGDRLEIEKQTLEQWDKIVAPKPELLQGAVDILRWNMENKTTTIVNFNNHVMPPCKLDNLRG